MDVPFENLGSRFFEPKRMTADIEEWIIPEAHTGIIQFTSH